MTAHERLESIKHSAGLPPNANVIIGKTGDVYIEASHDLIGNLITGH